MSTPSLNVIDHVTIVVRDLPAAIHDYSRLLGKLPTWQGTHPGLGTAAALFGLSNALIELIGPQAEAPEAEAMRSWLEQRGDGLQSIAFGTSDADACLAALRERGLRAAPPQDGSAVDAAGNTRHYRVIELSPRATRGLPVFAVQRADFEQLRSPPAPADDLVSALDHVVIRSAAPDAAIALYRDALGLRLSLDQQVTGLRLLFFRVGGVTFEVLHDASAGDHDLFYGLTYRVRNLDTAHARLRAAGITASELRTGKKPGTRVFNVLDATCGVATLFIEDPSRSYADAVSSTPAR